MNSPCDVCDRIHNLEMERDTARAKVDFRTSLLATVSHEVRTPMQGGFWLCPDTAGD
jgi:K+-sensing histidine kinase KdpD